MIRFFLLLLLLHGAEFLSNYTDDLERFTKVTLEAKDSTTGTSPKQGHHLFSMPAGLMNKTFATPHPYSLVENVQKDPSTTPAIVQSLQGEWKLNFTSRQQGLFPGFPTNTTTKHPTKMPAIVSIEHGGQSLLKKSKKLKIITPPVKVKSLKKITEYGLTVIEGQNQDALKVENMPKFDDTGLNVSSSTTNFASEVQSDDVDKMSLSRPVKTSHEDTLYGIRTHKVEHFTMGEESTTQSVRSPLSNILANSTLQSLMQNSSSKNNKLHRVAGLLSNFTSEKVLQEKDTTGNSLVDTELSKGRHKTLANFADRVEDVFGVLQERYTDISGPTLQEIHDKVGQKSDQKVQFEAGLLTQEEMNTQTDSEQEDQTQSDESAELWKTTQMQKLSPELSHFQSEQKHQTHSNATTITQHLITSAELGTDFLSEPRTGTLPQLNTHRQQESSVETTADPILEDRIELLTPPDPKPQEKTLVNIQTELVTEKVASRTQIKYKPATDKSQSDILSQTQLGFTVQTQPHSTTQERLEVNEHMQTLVSTTSHPGLNNQQGITRFTQQVITTTSQQGVNTTIQQGKITSLLSELTKNIQPDRITPFQPRFMKPIQRQLDLQVSPVLTTDLTQEMTTEIPLEESSQTLSRQNARLYSKLVTQPHTQLRSFTNHPSEGNLTMQNLTEVTTTYSTPDPLTQSFVMQTGQIMSKLAMESQSNLVSQSELNLETNTDQATRTLLDPITNITQNENYVNIKTKPDLDMNTQPDLVTRTLSDIITQTQHDLVTKSKFDDFTQIQPNLTANSQPHLSTQTKPDLTDQNQSDQIYKNQTDLTTQNQNDLTTNTHANLTYQTYPDLISKTKSNLVTESKEAYGTKNNPDPSTYNQAELVSKTMPQRSTQVHPDLVTQTQPALVTQSQADLVTQRQPDLFIQSQPDLVNQSHPGRVTHTQPDLVTQTQPDLVPQISTESSKKNNLTEISHSPPLQAHSEYYSKTKLGEETKMPLQLPTQSEPQWQKHAELTTFTEPEINEQTQSQRTTQSYPQAFSETQNKPTQATQKQPHLSTKPNSSLTTWIWPVVNEDSTERGDQYLLKNHNTDTQATILTLTEVSPVSTTTDISSVVPPVTVEHLQETGASEQWYELNHSPSQPPMQNTGTNPSMADGDSSNPTLTSPGAGGPPTVFTTADGLTVGKPEPRLSSESPSTLKSQISPRLSSYTKTPQTNSEVMSVHPTRDWIFIVDEQLPVFKVQTINVTYKMVLKSLSPGVCENPETCQARWLQEVNTLYKSVPGFDGVQLPNVTWNNTLLEYRIQLGVHVGTAMSETQELVLSDPRWLFESSQTMENSLSSQIHSISITEKHAEPCTDWFSCPAGFQCVPVRKLGARCQSPCHGLFCHNHGICIHRRGQDPECQCPIGRDFWYMGQTCDYRMTHHRLAAIACAVVFCIIISAAAAVFILVRRFQTQILQQKVAQTQSSYRRFSRFDDVPTHFWCPSQTWLTASASLNSLDNPAFSSSEEVFPLQALGSCVCGCQERAPSCAQTNPPQPPAHVLPR
ncbi:interphotoreceptor matrix proteoglycan 2-like isoform X1 [Pelobates cultripes]|nr:interphotoreceptor matrix proteoglycan 2-like isoform X1 [Pelobates cultripes]CAH2307519.1 interphotoreceptor matrix proteoglycan 2-like isoform X1 [Pelobates cultripes]